MSTTQTIDAELSRGAPPEIKTDPTDGMGRIMAERMKTLLHAAYCEQEACIEVDGAEFAVTDDPDTIRLDLTCGIDARCKNPLRSLLRTWKRILAVAEKEGLLK